ncbi:MAG TPA: hypothetical protein VI479_03155 [Blastocatellia bacterium]
MGLGIGELILILVVLLGIFAAVFAGIFFLVKYQAGGGGKTCPHCAEKIQAAAKVCRYCQRDVTGV